MSAAIDIVIGHSPDPDDVFMWWPLTGKLDPARLSPDAPAPSVSDPIIETSPFRFRGLAADIDVLNKRAHRAGDLDVTAISIGAWSGVADSYALTACGASMGYGYGPKLVASASSDLTPENFRSKLRESGRTLVIPGVGTSAYLTFGLIMQGLDGLSVTELPFDRIAPTVAAGHADAGLLIHQSQLTFEEQGLKLLVDVGAWWKESTGLPLPLGGNALRRDLDARHGRGTTTTLVSLLDRSIRTSLDRFDESLTYAMRFAPELDRQRAERYIAMYVNDLTLDMGEQGRMAIERLLADGAASGLCPPVSGVDLLRSHD